MWCRATYDGAMSRRLPAVLAAAAALVGGCGGGVDRASYVEKNLALLNTVATVARGEAGQGRLCAV